MYKYIYIFIYIYIYQYVKIYKVVLVLTPENRNSTPSRFFVPSNRVPILVRHKFPQGFNAAGPFFLLKMLSGRGNVATVHWPPCFVTWSWLIVIFHVWLGNYKGWMKKQEKTSWTSQITGFFPAVFRGSANKRYQFAKKKVFHPGEYFPQTGLPVGFYLTKKNRLDTLVGALGLVGRGFGPAGRAGLGWAWGLAVLGLARAGARWLGWACWPCWPAGWVGRGVGRWARCGRGVWACCAGRAGLGVGRGVWRWWGALTGLGVVFKVYYRSAK